VVSICAGLVCGLSRCETSSPRFCAPCMLLAASLPPAPGSVCLSACTLDPILLHSPATHTIAWHPVNQIPEKRPLPLAHLTPTWRRRHREIAFDLFHLCVAARVALLLYDWLYRYFAPTLCERSDRPRACADRGH
jgi:hypothetical protein